MRKLNIEGISHSDISLIILNIILTFLANSMLFFLYINKYIGKENENRIFESFDKSEKELILILFSNFFLLERKNTI